MDTYYLATPDERKRLTVHDGFAFPYVLIETWDDRPWVSSDGSEQAGSWIVTSHVPIGDLSKTEVEQAIEQTVTKFFCESFSEIPGFGLDSLPAHG